MFRDFYASKRELTQVSNNNIISVPSLTHRTHATRRENHPPFESPRFNQREKANEGSHLHSPRANTTPPPLFLQQQTTATQNNKNNQTSSPSNLPVVVQNVEKAKSASRYGNEVLFSVSQLQYCCHQSTPKESTPCFHSRETVELRQRKNEEQRERAANTFLLQQQHQQQRKKNEDYLQALAMRPMSPPEFTNGTGTVLTAEKRVAVAGTQTDENNEENETNARKGAKAEDSLDCLRREDEETIDELDISKRITSAVEKTLESVAKETRRGMEEIAMRTQRDVLRCAADVARMQRDLSEFMGRYGVKRKNSHRNDDDDDDNEDDVVYFGHTSEREIDAMKTASKKKQSTMTPANTPALVSMISDGKTPTNVVIAHIRENASIAELRAAYPLLFNGALSIRKRGHTARFLRKKISEGYVGYAAERERALAPTLPDKEKEELEMENNDIFTSRSKPKNKTVTIDDDDSDDENVELRVREEIEAFKRKTKARTARRRGFAVSTKLSIET
ncbi:unnamed protein product [Bathycoccus prasinos]